MNCLSGWALTAYRSIALGDESSHMRTCMTNCGTWDRTDQETVLESRKTTVGLTFRHVASDGLMLLQDDT